MTTQRLQVASHDLKVGDHIIGIGVVTEVGSSDFPYFSYRSFFVDHVDNVYTVSFRERTGRLKFWHIFREKETIYYQREEYV